MQASSATTNKPTKLIRTNSETLGLRPKNNPRSRPEQPFGKWDIGAPANLPTADVVVRVPRNLGNSSSSSEDAGSGTDSDPGNVASPPLGQAIEQPSITQTSAAGRVLNAMCRHPIKAVVVATALIGGVVATAVVLTTPGEDGRPIGAPPATPVEQLTKLVQEWLCQCGFAVDADTCYSIAEEFAYTIGASHSDSGRTGDVPSGWISEQLWSQCPSASELVMRIPGQSDAAFARNNAAQWAEDHADRNGGPAVMVQWLMLIAPLAMHAIFPG